MSWELTTLLLGLLVPITVAVIKLVPARSHPNGCKGDLKTELAVLTARYDAFNREVDQLRREMEALGAKLEAVRGPLLEANRRSGRQH